MKLSKLAIAVTLATSVALVGCGGKKSSSKKDAPVPVKDDKAQMQVKQLAFEANDVGIKGFGEDTVQVEKDGVIKIKLEQPEVNALKQAKRIEDVITIFVNHSKKFSAGVVDDDGQFVRADKKHLTVKFDQEAGLLIVSVKNHAPGIKSLAFVRTSELKKFANVDDLHRASFNILVNGTLPTAQLGLTNADGTDFTSELKKVADLKNNGEGAPVDIKNPLTPDSLKLDNDGDVKLVNVTVDVKADDGTALATTKVLNTLNGLALKALDADGITIEAIVKADGADTKAELQPIPVTDATPKSTTLGQAITAINGATHGKKVYGVRFTSDSGLGQRGEELVLIVKAVDASFSTETQKKDEKQRITNVVDTIINPAPAAPAAPAKG